MSNPTARANVRLTAVEPGGTDRPIEKPLAANLFVRPALGASVSPAIEPFLAYPPAISFDDLETALQTTGFEGIEGSEPTQPEVVEPVQEVPVVIAPPVARPVLEVKPAVVPIAVYEPMEFLDFDDEDAEQDGIYQQSVAEPEPEPEPPVLTEPFVIAFPKAAAPSVARMIQGVGPVTLPDVPAEIPSLTLTTVRPRLLRGPNPSAPKPAIEPKSQPKVEAKPAPQPSKTVPAVSKPQQPKPVPPPSEKERRAAAKTATPAPAAAVSPARSPRDRGNAVPVEEVVEAPSPAPKPKMVPIRKPEPVEPAAARQDFLTLGLESEQRSPMAKIAMVAGVLVVLAGGGYFAFSGGKAVDAATTREAPDIASPMAIGGGGWATTWGSESPVNAGKQISIYRPSMATPDYRFEFRGQIEKKAMGWVFRAQDPKNYYVMKLEALKQGLNPLVALVKYAVINGKETTRTQVMLPFDVNLATIYKVRLDVKGNKFSTYVQDKQIDYWTDDRIKLGGTGFYTETGERSQIKASQVSYLH